MSGIATPKEFLDAIHRWPGMYWGGGNQPFSSLVAFLAGYQFGHTNGQASNGMLPTDLVPKEFHDFVIHELLGRENNGGEGWMSVIAEQTASEQEAFELFFRLRTAYDERDSPSAKVDPPA